ncbi:hypothetical protein C2E23DRAFT_808418 [Lenzites betulinus]|nr:hypothetical protein C2E23DRAFT_808418 [Lenzites betulinus]
MPTATTTATTPTSVLSLKASHSSSLSSTAATLRSLYPRAARAFLQRDVALTHSLLASAFSFLTSPASVASVDDALASQRRKWDILRITFETTLYSSPPSAQDPELLPPALRANLLLPSEPFIGSLHNRSLQLFTPADSPQKPSSAFLPAQILVTIVLASLKLDCNEVGRSFIEDWIARHGQEDVPDDPKGYAKVIELYCLHVLPRLQDWDYAEDFLTYERELPSDVRQQYTASLRQLRAEAIANARAQAESQSLPSSSSTSSSRSASPTPSDSSASSSSTRTATPRSPRTNGRVRALVPFTPSQSPTPQQQEERDHDRRSSHSESSQSIASTATSRTVTPQSVSRERVRIKRPGAVRARLAETGSQSRSRSHSNSVRPAAAGARSASSASASSSAIPPPSAVLRDPTSVAGSAARAPSTLALLRATVGSVMQGVSRGKALAYVVFFVVLPLVSFVFRVRRARRAPSTGARAGGTVDAVRRRLRGADAQGGVVGQVWVELCKAVLDTVRMAGRGLV